MLRASPGVVEKTRPEIDRRLHSQWGKDRFVRGNLYIVLGEVSSYEKSLRDRLHSCSWFLL